MIHSMISASQCGELPVLEHAASAACFFRVVSGGGAGGSGTSSQGARRRPEGVVRVGRWLQNAPLHPPRRKPLIFRSLGEGGECGEVFSVLFYHVRARARVR